MKKIITNIILSSSDLVIFKGMCNIIDKIIDFVIASKILHLV
jgi:hypothetical protein